MAGRDVRDVDADSVTGSVSVRRGRWSSPPRPATFREHADHARVEPADGGPPVILRPTTHDVTLLHDDEARVVFAARDRDTGEYLRASTLAPRYWAAGMVIRAVIGLVTILVYVGLDGAFGVALPLYVDIALLIPVVLVVRAAVVEPLVLGLYRSRGQSGRHGEVASALERLGFSKLRDARAGRELDPTRQRPRWMLGFGMKVGAVLTGLMISAFVVIAVGMLTTALGLLGPGTAWNAVMVIVVLVTIAILYRPTLAWLSRSSLASTEDAAKRRSWPTDQELGIQGVSRWRAWSWVWVLLGSLAIMAASTMFTGGALEIEAEPLHQAVSAAVEQDDGQALIDLLCPDSAADTARFGSDELAAVMNGNPALSIEDSQVVGAEFHVARLTSAGGDEPIRSVVVGSDPRVDRAACVAFVQRGAVRVGQSPSGWQPGYDQFVDGF